MLFIMGKSGSGKDTLLKMLRDEFPDLEELLLYTTRPMRDGEQDGREYNFVSNEIMDYIIENNECALQTYNTVAGVWRYATVYKDIKDINKVVAVGPLNLYEEYEKHLKSNIVPIYLRVDETRLLERLLNRDKIEGESERRLKSDAKAFKNVDSIQNLMTIDNNGSLNDTYNKLKNIYLSLRG